jgi:hypothetical protein
MESNNLNQLLVQQDANDKTTPYNNLDTEKLDLLKQNFPEFDGFLREYKLKSHNYISFPLEEYNADLAIYVLSRICGEGADRRLIKGDVYLTDSEIKDILYLNQKYEKFMLVLNVCGPVDLTPVLDVKNILLLSQLGVVTGDILADIILGKANPS